MNAPLYLFCGRLFLGTHVRTARAGSYAPEFVDSYVRKAYCTITKEIGSLHDLITWPTFDEHENSSLLKNFVRTSWKSILKLGDLRIFSRIPHEAPSTRIRRFLYPQIFSSNFLQIFSKKGRGRKLVPRDFVRCEPHHSVTEVNETGNAKATDRC